MKTAKRIIGVYNKSKVINIDDQSKIIIMSDCHRGDGRFGDNFSDNKLLFMAALNYYYNRDYTYIEIGDGDELWENKYLSKIIINYSDVFKLMSKFYKRNKLYMLYGNHDIIKRDKIYTNNVLREYFDEKEKKYIELFPHIEINEGLILNYKYKKILLIHGHQGDFLNDTLWRVSRMLVRYLWRPLELIGIHNPTSAANNDKKKQNLENKLIDWTIKNDTMIIAGHTHKIAFPVAGENLYFNDGCCTHPRSITGIEINEGNICLIKWSIKTRNDRTLYVEREVIRDSVKIEEYFNKK
jgi:predicted phosphodiesterase